MAIDSLLDKQIEMLSNQKTSLRKEATLDGEVKNSVLEISDSAAWARELDVFRQLEQVNSPVYADKYKIEDGLPDPNSNLRILSFSTSEKIPITFLKIYYQDTHDKIRKIEGSFYESNSIYAGARNLSLEFREIQGQCALMQYNITGGQKMMLADSVTYTIKGTIDYQ